MTRDTLTPAAAWELLRTGNERFASEQCRRVHQDSIQRVATLTTQHPYAVIITCSDSRVPPEILFDCGIGDLFVVRVAGNIITPEVLGTVEFAVKELATPLVVVFGHRGCVAVGKAMSGGVYEGSFQSIIDGIRNQIKPSNDETRDVEQNAMASVQALRVSTILNEQIAKGTLQIQAAYYDNQSGRIRPL